MSPRTSLNRLVRSAAVGVAGVRVQALVAAVGYFFYGYWFSQRRA